MRSRIVAALAACAVVHTTLAGPLDPPAGPIAPTNKTLGQVEPRIAISAASTPGDPGSLFKITQSGSYYLTGDIVGAPGQNGIRIEGVVGSVTIDLNGFTLRGVAGALDGIDVSTGSPVRVVNGVVADWPGTGIDSANTVDRVIARNNGGAGIVASANAMITNCSAIGNGVAANAYGIQTLSSATVLDCVATNNGGAGGGGGIAVGTGSQVRRCIANGNFRGGTSGTGYGIAMSFDCVASECRVNDNGSPSPAVSGGILGSTGTSVTGCTLFANLGDGIRSSGEGTVAFNTVGGTGGNGIGILVTSGPVRVEGNHLFNNGVGGVRVLGIGSSVFRNTARGNPAAYDVAGGNDMGPIGTAATSTSPWANLAN